MRLCLLSFFLLWFMMPLPSAVAQELYFPPLTGDAWETLSYEEAGWCEEYVPDLIQYLDSIDSKAFIVLQDGKIVIEHYFDSFTQDSLWYWASAGKVLSSFAVGMAQEQGLLSIDDPSSMYLGKGWTSLTPEQEEAITIRHQLTMTSGLDDGLGDSYCTLDTCLQYLADPGTRWAYHNGPYTLLKDVISGATGQSINTYLNSVLKTQIGMDGFFFPVGYNNIYLSTPRSMARFGLLMLNEGIWDGNTVMADQEYFQAMINTSQDLNKSYGYLWWLNGKESFKLPGIQFNWPGSLVPNAPADMYAAIGMNGQILHVVPGENFLFIRMGNASSLLDAVPVAMNNQIWARINQARCKTSALTGIEPEGIHIYPNPATRYITIDAPSPVEEIYLINSSGKRQRVEMRNGKVWLFGRPEGIYFIECKIEGKRIVKKFAISR